MKTCMRLILVNNTKLHPRTVFQLAVTPTALSVMTKIMTQYVNGHYAVQGRSRCQLKASMPLHNSY